MQKAEVSMHEIVTEVRNKFIEGISPHIRAGELTQSDGNVFFKVFFDYRFLIDRVRESLSLEHDAIVFDGVFFVIDDKKNLYETDEFETVFRHITYDSFEFFVYDIYEPKYCTTSFKVVFRPLI